jgi:hypothetical protein
MPVLSGEALDLDPFGCALLAAMIAPKRIRLRPSSKRREQRQGRIEATRSPRLALEAFSVCFFLHGA